MKDLNRNSGIDYAEMYDQHTEYRARRVDGSYESRQIEIEVHGFKIPKLVSCLPSNYLPKRVLEIGCATGELIAAFPVQQGGQRFGSDISEENVASAKKRYPNVKFFAGGFDCLPTSSVDCVILSDILEHVEDDKDFLVKASQLTSRYLLVNIPLEDNWTNVGRNYGPGDSSGHLRKYSLQEALTLLEYFPGRIINWSQSWVHETEAHESRKLLRQEITGYKYRGVGPVRYTKALIEWLAKRVPAFGRRLHPSNLFALLEHTPAKSRP